jgi:hypothetical protein
LLHDRIGDLGRGQLGTLVETNRVKNLDRVQQLLLHINLLLADSGLEKDLIAVVAAGGICSVGESIDFRTLRPKVRFGRG